MLKILQLMKLSIETGKFLVLEGLSSLLNEQFVQVLETLMIELNHVWRSFLS